eukprot:359937-Chlamydomonas_euryale.AAC.21
MPCGCELVAQAAYTRTRLHSSATMPLVLLLCRFAGRLPRRRWQAGGTAIGARGGAPRDRITLHGGEGNQLLFPATAVPPPPVPALHVWVQLSHPPCYNPMPYVQLPATPSSLTLLTSCVCHVLGSVCQAMAGAQLTGSSLSDLQCMHVPVRYLPIGGLKDFVTESVKLAYGDHAEVLRDNQVRHTLHALATCADGAACPWPAVHWPECQRSCICNIAVVYEAWLCRVLANALPQTAAPINGIRRRVWNSQAVRQRSVVLRAGMNDLDSSCGRSP